MEMVMGPKEMAVAFRTAKKKAEQIKIFSEINCMPVDEVKRILRAEGCQLRGVGDAPEARKNAAGKTKVKVKPAMEEVKMEEVEVVIDKDERIPEYIISVINEKIADLNMLIKSKELEIQKIRNQELELTEFVKSCNC